MLRRFTAANVLLLSFFALSVCFAEKLPKAARTPVAPTDEQKQLISEGIKLHDRGEYDAAIARYQGVLDKSPDVIEAMYECAYSLGAKKDYEKELEFARRGAQYRSDLLWQFHMLIGNALDDLGKHQEAVELFKDAIKQSPKIALLHYNLGLTLVRIGSLSDARKSIQEGLYLDPVHPSSHYLLAQIYDRLGYRVPAILAVTRFLTLEPESPRSRDATMMLGRLLSAGVGSDAKSGNITLTLNDPSSSKTDEGNFGPVEFSLLLTTAATKITKEGEKNSPFADRVTMFSVLAEILGEVKGGGFAAKYYAPFFAQIEDRKLTSALVYVAFSAAPIEGAESWRVEEPGKLDEFQSWFPAYVWPSK